MQLKRYLILGVAITIIATIMNCRAQQQFSVALNNSNTIKNSNSSDSIVPKIAASKAAQSTITVINNINKQDTGYTKFLKQFFPNKFTVKINGKPLKYGEKMDITPGNKTFRVEYSYVWDVPLVYHREGKKEVQCVVPPQCRELKVNFAGWDKEDKERIQVAVNKKM